MLLEYRSIYEDSARAVPNWKQFTISELCYKYLEYIDIDYDKASAYLSGIIAKCLSNVIYDYNKQTTKWLSEEEYYDILIESILYVLDKKIWEDPKSSLYHNSNAPEIAIRTTLKSGKINLYVFNQRDKRRLNQRILSLDALEEESSDGYYLPYEDKDISYPLYLKRLIKEYFSYQDYLYAFILDNISKEDLFIRRNNQLRISKSKVKSMIDNLGDAYCNHFCKEYDFSLKNVQDALQYCKNLNRSKLDYSVDTLVRELHSNKELYRFLRNDY